MLKNNNKKVNMYDFLYLQVYWTNDKTTHLTGIHDTCRRTIEPGITGNFTFNISSAGMLKMNKFLFCFCIFLVIFYHLTRKNTRWNKSHANHFFSSRIRFFFGTLLTFLVHFKVNV